MIEKSRQSKPVCQSCKKKGAVKTTLLGVPVCEDCYRKLDTKPESLFEEK